LLHDFDLSALAPVEAAAPEGTTAEDGNQLLIFLSLI
jgi:hypothetical protein